MQQKSTCSSSFPSNQYVAFLGQPSMQLFKWVSKWSFPRKKLLGRAHAWPPLACNGHVSSFYFFYPIGQIKNPQRFSFQFFFSNSIFFFFSSSKFQFLNVIFKFLFSNKFFKIPISKFNFQFPNFQNSNFHIYLFNHYYLFIYLLLKFHL